MLPPLIIGYRSKSISSRGEDPTIVPKIVSNNLYFTKLLCILLYYDEL